MKTFYSVRYTGLGFYGAITAWFDNEETAKKFAEKECTENPIKHTFKLTPHNSKKIANIERLVKYQEKMLEWF